jgi:hypothetical protein
MLWAVVKSMASRYCIDCIDSPDWAADCVEYSRAALGVDFVGEYRAGGAGKTPDLPNNHATRSVGWAPTDTQYLILFTLSRTSFTLSLFAMGLYVPS